MPYTIRKVKGDKQPFKIVNTDKNKVVGSSKTKANAVASIRARLSGEHSKK
ncbi:MAG TPA: hypothetical protein VMW91_10485 [Desulfosporosinus sp.]|nr:hypothetical protein [Desulfosporosinus sp.]